MNQRARIVFAIYAILGWGAGAAAQESMPMDQPVAGPGVVRTAAGRPETDGTEPNKIRATGNRVSSALRSTAKPTAPIEVRWLAAGEDGTVSLQIVSGVDHVGASVRVIGPGIGRPLVAQLPAATAGEIQTAEWTLDGRTGQSLRAIIEIDAGDSVMARTAVLAPTRGKPVRRAPSRPSKDKPAANTNAPRNEGVGDGLVELPVEQTIRRGGE